MTSKVRGHTFYSFCNECIDVCTRRYALGLSAVHRALGHAHTRSCLPRNVWLARAQRVPGVRGARAGQLRGSCLATCHSLRLPLPLAYRPPDGAEYRKSLSRVPARLMPPRAPWLRARYRALGGNSPRRGQRTCPWYVLRSAPRRGQRTCPRC